MSITRKRQFPYTVTIDEQPVRLLLKRMAPPEFEEFRAMFISLGQSRGAPATLTSIIAQKKEHLSTKSDEPLPPIIEDVSLEDLKAESAYLRANSEWQQDVFDAYVSVVPDDVFDEDEEGNRIPVTSGRQFAEMFHGQGVIAKILAELYLANTLTEEQKKTLRSRSDSATGSNAAASQATPGETPAPTAENVGPCDSASGAAVTAALSVTSSGTTAPSSSESVPCAP